MFAVNGNRPGPFPAGQTYGEILRRAKEEQIAANRITPPADHNGDDLEPLNAALGVRNDRVIVQSEIETYPVLVVGVFDTSKGVLGLAFGAVAVQH